MGRDQPPEDQEAEDEGVAKGADARREQKRVPELVEAVEVDLRRNCGVTWSRAADACPGASMIGAKAEIHGPALALRPDAGVARDTIPEGPAHGLRQLGSERIGVARTPRSLPSGKTEPEC